MSYDFIEPAVARAAKVQHTAKVAAELGTRAAARRLGINKDTVTRYLQLANGIEPTTLRLFVERNGPRGFRARASGVVRQRYGKDRKTVRFSCAVEAFTLPEVLEAVLHQAMAAAAKKASP